jgi:hypothetical protein
MHIFYKENENSLASDFEVLRAIIDASNLDPHDPCYDISNKGEGGAFKNEFKSLKCIVVCSPQLKKYIMVCENTYENNEVVRKIACGGISKHHMDSISFKEYKDGLWLFNLDHVEEFQIKSHHQQLYSVRIDKLRLLNLYIHRKVLADHITTVPWGFLHHIPVQEKKMTFYETSSVQQGHDLRLQHPFSMIIVRITIKKTN